MKNLTILILLGEIVWLGSTVMRLERQRYTMQLHASALSLNHVCAEKDAATALDCLRNYNPRSNNLWNLYDGLIRE